MGILFSLVALISWGIGDFLIQRSARKFGDWMALFYIAVFSAIVLFPFVYKDLMPLLWNEKGVLILAGTALVMTIASYFDFEALRIGKISVVEPIYAFEIAVTAALSTIFIKEHLAFWQIVLVAAIIAGIFLVSAKSLHHFKNIKWEKGIVLAIVATIAMGTTNFLYGVGARDTNPLLINWFVSMFIVLVSLCFLLATSKLKYIIPDLKNNGRLIVSVSFIDNLAWIAFSYAALYIPIAVAISISESYIVLAAILGMKFNKEKLKSHQKLGLVLTVAAAIALAVITKD